MMVLDDLVIACVVDVEPKIIKQIIMVESGGNPLAINVNAKEYKIPVIKTKEEAIRVANDAINKGYSADLGYMQVNTRNLTELRYSVADMFEPCKNIIAGSRIYKKFHNQAVQVFGEKNAMQNALSAYNTGDFWRGINNGYVARYGVQPISHFSAAETAIITNFQQRKEQSMTVIPVVSENPADGSVSGTQIVFTPEEAERNGAVLEKALNEKEAWESIDSDSTAIVVNGQVAGKTNE